MPQQSRSNSSVRLRMLYFLIPYLVAYTGSNSGKWKYGPEHVFAAQVYNNLTLPAEAAVAYSEARITFACRPMNLSVIHCRTESGSMDRYEVADGSTTRKGSAHYDDIAINNITFQIKFDESGISRVWFLNENRTTKINMILSIIGTLSTGMRVAGKTFGNYSSLEKSIIGVCKTNFNIGKRYLTEEEEEEEEEATLEADVSLESRLRPLFEIPPLGTRMDDATIVIEKVRNVNDCVKKTPYFFGSTEGEDAKAGYKYDKFITYSKSAMNLGEDSFSAYTENRGTIMDDLPEKKGGGQVEMRSSELIRVSLQSIRPAKEKLSSAANVGAGFEPGTPWPERSTQ